MECPEFRSLLLLLRPKMADKDIPHRSKVRETVLKLFESWFQSLKNELSVCFVVGHAHVSLITYTEILVCCRKDFFYG